MQKFVILIGSVGAALTTVSLLPQVIKVLKSRHTKDLSFLTYVVLTTGVALWIVYSLLLHQPPIYVANIITLIFSLTILIFKIKFG